MNTLSLDTYFAGAVIVIGGALLSIGGLVFVRSRVEIETLRHYHDVASSLLSVVGTLYAVLLGLIVVDNMAKFQQAHMIVGQEANAIANIFELADGLPSAKRIQIQKLCTDYVREIVDREWALMNDGKCSHRAEMDRVQLWKAVLKWEPQTESEKAIYSSLLDHLGQFTDARRDRLVISAHGVAASVWFVLFVGAIFTVVFTYFFGLDDFKSQIFMTAGVSLLIGLNLLLVDFYGYPFSGDVKVWPEEFQRDERIFEETLKSQGEDIPEPTKLNHWLPNAKLRELKI